MTSAIVGSYPGRSPLWYSAQGLREIVLALPCEARHLVPTAEVAKEGRSRNDARWR